MENVVSDVETASQPSETSGIVGSVVKALRVLDCFSATRGRLTLAHISQELRLPKSTTLNLVRTLEQQDYLLRRPDQTYQLGYKVLELSYYLRSSLPIVQHAVPFMEELQIKTGEIVYLTSHTQGRVLYLEGVYPSIRMGNYSIAGKTLPLHCTGCGKAMMAYLGADELDWVLENRPLARSTPNTVTDRDELLDELQRIRERGYAIDVEEETVGVKCVGVAIRDSDGYPVGALSVSGTVISMKDELVDEYARMLSHASHSLSNNAAPFPAAQLRGRE